MLRHLIFLGLLFTAAFAGAASEGQLAPGMVNPGYEEPPKWFKESFLDLQEDVAEAAKSGRRLLLYFYQDGCPYCTRLLKDNFGNERIAAKTRRQFDVIAINIWGDREVTDLAGKATTEKAYARSLRVQFTPTLLLFDEQGEVALRLNGYLQPAKFEAALDYAGARMEKKLPFADYLAAHAREPGGGSRRVSIPLLKPPLRLADSQRSNPGPLLVLFEQKNCAACGEMHGEVLTRPEVTEQLRRFQVARIDTASGAVVQTPSGESLRARDWARRLGIFYAPTLVFFDADGREAFRVDGYLRAFHVASALDYVASGAFRTQPEFQRFVEERAAGRRGRGERVDLLR